MFEVLRYFLASINKRQKASMKIHSATFLFLSLLFCPYLALGGDDEPRPLNEEQKKLLGLTPEQQEQRGKEKGSEVSGESGEGLTEEEKEQRKKEQEAEAKRRLEEYRKYEEKRAQQWVETRMREIREANERKERIRQQEEQQARAAREREERRLKNEEARRWLEVRAGEIREAKGRRLSEEEGRRQKEEASKAERESGTQQTGETGKQQSEEVLELIHQNYAKQCEEETERKQSERTTGVTKAINKNAAAERHGEQQAQTKRPLHERNIDAVESDMSMAAGDLIKMIPAAMRETSEQEDFTLKHHRAEFYFQEINKLEIRFVGLENELQELARKNQTTGNALQNSINIDELRKDTKEALEAMREYISILADESM